MKKVLIIILVFFLSLSCGNNGYNFYFNELKMNVTKLDNLRAFIEKKYSFLINDTTTNGINFINSSDKKPKYKRDIFDKEIASFMREIKIKEIVFKSSDGKGFDEIYFERDKFFYYPIIYYLYERKGSSDVFISYTIYYKPVNEHWGLYVDSNYP